MIESFERAMAFAREVVADCDILLLDRMQMVHDHEIEQLRRSRFREGYEAGQRSMDAEHYQLKLRLQGLRFVDGSHENLSRLAYAIYPCPTGWDKESCEGLRDKLIELLGGVHDEPAQVPASCGSCDADCNCGHGDETAVAYDALGNERHKAIANLRDWEPDKAFANDNCGEIQIRLLYQLLGLGGALMMDGADAAKKVRDRLIHLLGGDECNFSVGKNYMDDMGEKSNPAETSDTSTGHVILDTPLPNFSEPNLSKSAEIAKPESEDSGENCRITDELRKWMDLVLTSDDQAWDIADRIDEQFNRICWQQEAVLQQTIDTMVDERDKLVDNRDMWRGKAMQLTDVVDRYVGRYEDLLDLLRDAVVDFKNANYSWNYALIVGENITIETELNRLAKERDELRKSLREIAERVGVPHDIDLDEYSDDLVAKATLGKIYSMHEYIDALEWQRDRQRKLLDEYENADTPEEIVRDIHLGIATDTQAVERIRTLP